MSESTLFTTFAEVEPIELQWLWYPYVPMRHLTLVYGEDEETVRLFLLELATRLSTGRIGDKPDENRRIHFEDGMLNPGWIKGKLESSGADTAMVSFRIGEGIESLLSAKDEFLKAGVKTLILSSVEDFIITKKSVKQAEVNRQLKQLSSFADYVGCAVVLGSRTLHTKNDDISRSLAEPLRRMPRSILEIGAEDNGFSIRQIKNNLAPAGESITMKTGSDAK